MSNIDTLQIYDDLKASGIPEEQAHAQAKAIANSNRITPEDLAAMTTRYELDFSHLENRLNRRFDKLDRDLLWMRTIGAAMIMLFFGNIILAKI